MTVYSYTGSTQTHTVGAGVVAVLIECKGASGGGAAGKGLGATVSGLFPVTPGEVLTVEVGGQGQSGGTGLAGGYNGGGANGIGTNGAGSGGGASDVRRGGTGLANRIIVAGGGGGYDPFSTPISGDGGYPNGEAGQGISPAGGGTQTAGGVGGGIQGIGEAGSFGQGGAANISWDSGGGGGGWYGGGGGGRRTGFGGGYGSPGGGSSYIGSVTAVADGSAPFGPLIEGAVPPVTSSNVSGTHDGDGEVTITEYTADAFGVDASGGTESDSGRYHYHVFTSSADLVITTGGRVDAWLIGGGGGGGSSNNSFIQAGGAGAGGVVELKDLVLAAGTYPVVIGAAGVIGTYPANGTDGGDSTFAGFTAKGGAQGNRSGPGGTGGSGAGGGNSTAPGAARTRQGRAGGASGGSNTFGGGGGGAGGVGNTGANGRGGPGITINGVVYASGGRGSNGSDPTGYGGPGSGGRSSVGPSAVAGQPGVVIVRYFLPYSIADADLTIDPVVSTTVEIVPPKSLVLADLTIDPVVSTPLVVKTSRRVEVRREYLWVSGLDGVQRGVIR